MSKYEYMLDDVYEEDEYVDDDTVIVDIDEIEESFTEYTYLHSLLYEGEYIDFDKLRDYFKFKFSLIALEEYEKEDNS